MLPGIPQCRTAAPSGFGFDDVDPVLDADVFQDAAMLQIGKERLDRWAMTAAMLKPEALITTINQVFPPASN